MSSINGAAGGLNPHSTPTRERLPFPQSANPSPGPSLRQTATSSASGSFTHLPSTSSPTPSYTASQQPISVEAILKQHSSSQDPKGAALDQAVNERNVLCGQNTQLWKLIEKQRAGYNQILKELERIRGERDAYKGKLSTLMGSGSGGDKRQKSIDRTNRPSLDTVTSQSGSSSDHTHPNPRQTMTRHFSDDAPTPRHPQPSLHSSRSHEPLSPPTREASLPTVNSYPSTRSSSPPPPPPPASAPSVLNTPPPSSARSPRPSPAPLVVPPRAETLPLAAGSSAVSATSETAPYSRQHYPSDMNGSSTSVNGVYSNMQPRTATYTRKSSIADSVSSVVTSGSSMSISTPSTTASSSINLHSYASHSQPAHSEQQFQALTPQTAPANFNQSLSDSQLYSQQRTPTISSTPMRSQTQPPPQIVMAAPSPSAEPVPPQNQVQAQMLSTILESRPHLLSRDSRISLPDEAKNYIANMVDSPVPSPKVDAFTHKPKSSSSLALPNGGSTVPQSEFLDMDEEDEDEEEGEDEDEDDIVDETDNNPTYTRAPEDGALDNPRAGEDFPLPPPTNPYIQRPQDSQSQYSQASSVSLSNHAEAMTDQQQPIEAPPPYMGEAFSPLENPYSPPNSQQQRIEQQRAERQELQRRGEPSSKPVPASFRALPLLSSDLPHTSITVSQSFVRPNDRGKEVLSFIVSVNPGKGKEGWKVEKMYSDVLSLDQRVRGSVGKGVGKKIASLPEGKLWKDHAPAKVDQRKAVLENYLQTLINLPVKNNDEVIAFFTSDIVRETNQPVMQAGHKEGYLTKRGKNFGGWKTRYFVLSGPVLEYYDCRGGAHLGSITVTGAQIGRQQRTERAPTTDEEKEYRHAFLIVEAKRGPGGNHPRHVLCAESDEDRDSWVEMLVRYFSGTYSEEPINYGSGYSSANATSTAPPRSSTSSTDNQTSSSGRRPTIRGMSKDDISISKGPAVPISALPPDANNAKLFQTAPLAAESYTGSLSPSKSIEPSPIDRTGSGSIPFDSQNPNARRILERGQGLPSSLPDSSPLSAAQAFQGEHSNLGQRANSELGHYPDMRNRQQSPEQQRTREHDGRKSFYPTLNPVASSPTTTAPPEQNRVPSPEKLDVNGKVKISGPLNGAPIPSGFKFGGKDAPSAESGLTVNDRREKAKSRSFWGFGKGAGDKAQASTHVPRAVFGVPLEESLDVAQICNLPAIVFRAIQYLEAKKADQEEGIYRLSGSSAVIKSLKDRFNTEGDVDLLASDEYWDPHAIAGLLKSFLRELPASILTRDLHLRFLAVIDFVDAQERIKELSQLIAALPIANYSLLRALTAHLILIVQNSGVNKMTMRNVGIVFSPTLGIPAGVFSLMLGEFNRVFNVDADNDDAMSPTGEKEDDGTSEPHRRNSRRYSEAAADQVLGLSGRTLKTSAEEIQSDGDDFSINDESGTETTEGEATVESSTSSPGRQEHSSRPTPPDTPMASKTTKASNVAASRGLNVTVSDRGNRHSRMIGLPNSPRPSHSPSHQGEAPASASPTRSRME